MPNIGEVLKSEIARLSKRVVRQYVNPIQSATAGHRKQLAALKKQVQQLERELTLLRRDQARHKPAPEVEDNARHRFTAKGLKSLRSRLGLSAEEFGRLVEVGPQTIYNWESEKTAPRPAQVSAIADLRKVGKKEVRQRLSNGRDETA